MKIKQTLLVFALLVGMSSLFIGPTVSAGSCGDAQNTSIISCDTCPNGEPANDKGLCSDGSTPSAIMGLLRLAIKILTAGIGIAAVGGVIYGSVLYTTAGGSADQTKKAKMIIFNVVIGLVAYALMFSFLNFLIPGGIGVI